MKLKTVEIEGKTYAEISDGKPVYIEDDGKETAFDAPATRATITRLNGEAKGHREAKETAEAALKKFEGIEDPKAALDAIQKVKSLSDKDLVDAGKVDEIKAATIKAKDDEYKPVVEERDTLKKALHDEKIGGSFARSKFIAEKTVVPADMIQAHFGRHFSIEEGNIVAKDAHGNQIYSKSNPGNPAGFDEALEIIVDQYPHKEHILKGTGAGGGGSKPGNGNGSGGEKTISRSDFESLSHPDRNAKIADGFTISD